jgi:hypothetical protein
MGPTDLCGGKISSNGTVGSAGCRDARLRHELQTAAMRTRSRNETLRRTMASTSSASFDHGGGDKDGFPSMLPSAAVIISSDVVPVVYRV